MVHTVEGVEVIFGMRRGKREGLKRTPPPINSRLYRENISRSSKWHASPYGTPGQLNRSFEHKI